MNGLGGKSGLLRMLTDRSGEEEGMRDGIIVVQEGREGPPKTIVHELKIGMQVALTRTSA